MKKHINIKPNLGRMRLFIFTALMLVMSHIAFAQAIQVLNIPDTGNRGNLPSNAKGYHLSATTSTGANMVNAKAKLTSVANFGPSGIVNRQLQITDGLGNRGDITSISQLNGYSIIYIGAYVRTDTSPSIFTPTEINILLAWSKQPGKVLMVQEQSASSAYPQANPISTAMGYGITNSSAYPNTSVLPADIEQNTKLFSGVFGTVSGSITQNGSAKGHFNAGCANNRSVNSSYRCNQKCLCRFPIFRRMLFPYQKDYHLCTDLCK